MRYNARHLRRRGPEDIEHRPELGLERVPLGEGRQRACRAAGRRGHAHAKSEQSGVVTRVHVPRQVHKKQKDFLEPVVQFLVQVTTPPPP